MNSGLLLSALCGGLLVLAAEYLRRQKKINNETTRKIIHIAHALTVATWPFFTSYGFIIAAEAIFIAVVILARQWGILQALRNVKRKSWGEVFFGLAVIALALIKPGPEIFLAAVLHLGLADGMATIVGQRVKSKAYFVFGQRKTVAGTAAFALTSITIIASLAIFSELAFTTNSYLLSLLVFPIVTALAENTSPYGSDNLSVPLLVLGIFTILGL
ncbi:MAG: hypothetical protein V4702_00250 [Patescibacteria group bacterium]